MSSDKQPNDLFNAAKSKMSIWAESLILEDGLNPSDKDELGNTPLFYAVEFNARVRSSSTSIANMLDTIQVFVENEANVDLTNNKGQNALEYSRDSILKSEEYNTWIKIAEILYGKSYKERVNQANLKHNNKSDDFSAFSEPKLNQEKTNPTNSKIPTDNLVLSAVFGLAFFLCPVLTLYFTWADLFSLSSDWLWIDNIIVGLALLSTGATFFLFLKEKVYPKLSLFFIPPLIACVLYFILVLSFFHPSVRYEVKKYYYNKNDTDSFSRNYWVEIGFYEDFLNELSGEKLRSDKELLAKLTFDLKKDFLKKNLRQGIGEIDFAKQALTVYISYREMGLSVEEIFSKPESVPLIYAIAFAESNPQYAQIESIPEIFSRKYIHLDENSKYPLGILNDSAMQFAYDSFFANLEDQSELDTEFALFLLTQIPVNIDEFNFEKIIEHWIRYKPYFKNELRYLTVIRNELRKKFKSAARKDKPLILSLETNSEENLNWVLVKPIFTSTGFFVQKGDGLPISFHSVAEFIGDKKAYKTKAVKKTRSVPYTVYGYGKYNRSHTAYRTETYTDFVSDGYDVVSTYIYSFSFPDVANPNAMKLCGMLEDCTLEMDKQIPTESKGRGETWIYALPQKLVCPIGCDGR